MNKQFLKSAVEGITKYKSTSIFTKYLILYLSFNKDIIVSKANSKSLNINSKGIVLNDFELYKINNFKIDESIKKEFIDSVNLIILNNQNIKLNDIDYTIEELGDDYNIFNVIFKFVRK